MNQIFIDSLVVFITQIIFIASRTVNIKAIADKNMNRALFSGAVIHIAWLISLTIGAVSVKAVIKDFNYSYIPVVLCSLIGGLLGTYYGLKNKFYEK